MGFAGQVFAARVAVGLAMPSPNAFSQAGALIGGFASNMYKRLNKDNVTAGQQQLKSAQENLGKARDVLAKHSANQNKFMENSANQAIAKMRDAYKGLGKAAMESAGAMGKMRKSSALSQGTKVKLFANALILTIVPAPSLTSGFVVGKLVSLAIGTKPPTSVTSSTILSLTA